MVARKPDGLGEGEVTAAAAAQGREGAYLRQLFEQAPGAIVVLDHGDTVRDANLAFLELFRYDSVEEVRGRTINSLIVPPELWEEASETSRRVLEGERIEQQTKRRRRDGSLVEVVVRAVPIRLDGRQSGIYGMYHDVSARRRAERALERGKELAEVTLHSIGDAVIRTDEKRRIADMNPVAEDLTGWRLDEARGRRLREVVRIINEQTRRPVPDPVRRCLRDGTVVGFSDHSVLVGRDGSELGVEHSAAPVRDRKGRVLGAVLVFRDVTERRRLQQEIKYRASHDALTSLCNRHVFEEALTKLLRDRRSASHRSALLYIDLDHFKIVNDTHGHAVGDALLRQVAQRMRGWVREADLVARIGGDEFGVILADCTVPEAQRRAETVLVDLSERPFHVNGDSFLIGASIGVVALDRDIKDLEQALNMADTACYLAKGGGGGSVHVYEDRDRDVRIGDSEMQWVTRLDQVLQSGKLELYGQEIRPLGSNPELQRHCELLVRVHDEAGREVPTGRFIKATERYGLIGALDRWVCERAIAILRDWPKGKAPPGIVDINIAASSLGDPEFLQFVREQLSAGGIGSGKICFEISEAAAVANLEKTKAFIREVHDLGCAVSIDDFGGSKVSFSYLRELGVDYLKIDRSLVAQVATDPFQYTIVNAIHRIGVVARIPSIAKGVEQPEALAVLRKIGVRYGQGVAMHQPEPWPGREAESANL